MKFENHADHITFNEVNRLIGRFSDCHGHLVYDKPRNDSTVNRKARASMYRQWAIEEATPQSWHIKGCNRRKANHIHAIGMTVDHDIPLFGCDAEGNHIVCGLNVPDNYVPMSKENNGKKGNLFVDTEYSRDRIAGINQRILLDHPEIKLRRNLKIIENNR